MFLSLKNDSGNCFGSLKIFGSKSESNRLLILKAIFPGIKIRNISDSDDTKILSNALNSKSNEIDVNHAGTAMRFLTAFFSSIPGRKIILTGSNRMQERPIKILVDALNSLGANINYVNKNGFPPINISGQELISRKVFLEADVSSQYISALMLIAPSLKNGIEINLKKGIVSKPYIEMTRDLLNYFGIRVLFTKNKIEINPISNIENKVKLVESDWSSASYYFSIVSLCKQAKISLNNFKQKSLQGDSVLVSIYEKFGVKTTFIGDEMMISKIPYFNLPKSISLDLNDSPDIAQTIAVSCFGLGINCKLSGLKTLKIKETDRLIALKNELEKLGAEVNLTQDSISISSLSPIKNNIIINTYNDHRMAMAFAPLGLKTKITIENPMVVGKSYPLFWDHLEQIGFEVEKDINF
ncbi:MAG: 3-phosphoshikimate 1-carboxyvinyltransferase [Flavobacteriaceae bacterium]|nr:3-phosphoshikimate 1-carboxyvinyltransferase [Flavobacteriaceae bacterium]